MIKDVAGAQYDKSPAGDAAKELQQPAVSRAVDAGRPRNRDRQARSSGRFAGDLLALHLRDLIDVSRPERCVLVRRWMFDVSMDADGAAMHEALDAGRSGRFDQMADGVSV